MLLFKYRHLVNNEIEIYNGKIHSTEILVQIDIFKITFSKTMTGVAIIMYHSTTSQVAND